MGIDCGIFVRQQITDEDAWREAMREVRWEFQFEECFKVEVPPDYIPSMHYEKILTKVKAFQNTDAGSDLAKIIMGYDVCYLSRLSLIF